MHTVGICRFERTIRWYMLKRTILKKFIVRMGGKSNNVGRLKVFELIPIIHSFSGQRFNSTKNIKRHMEKNCTHSAT
jgi:hypothetical protein